MASKRKETDSDRNDDKSSKRQRGDFKTSYGTITTSNFEDILLRTAITSKFLKDQTQEQIDENVVIFNDIRCKSEWEQDDINICVRTLGKLFTSKQIEKIAERIFLSVPRRTKKSQLIVSLIKAPIILERNAEGQVDVALRPGMYGLPETKQVEISVSDLSNILQDKKSETEKQEETNKEKEQINNKEEKNPEEKANKGKKKEDNDISRLREVEAIKVQMELLKARLAGIQKEKVIIKEKKVIIEDENPKDDDKRKEAKNIPHDEEDERYDDYAMNQIKIISAMADLTKHIQSLGKIIEPKKKEGEEDTEETRQAIALLKAGKMSEFYEFERLARNIKIKILTFQYFDLKVLMASKDGLSEQKTSKTLLPGITVTSTKDLELSERGFTWGALNDCFSTLALWANTFAPEKVGMILGFQKVLSDYNRARYPLEKLFYFSNHVRQRSSGKNANWTDRTILDEAFRLKLQVLRDPTPNLTNWPMKPEFQTDNFRQNFRGRGYFRGYFRGNRGRGGHGRGRGRGRGRAEVGQRICRNFQKGEPCKFADQGQCRFLHKKISNKE